MVSEAKEHKIYSTLISGYLNYPFVRKTIDDMSNWSRRNEILRTDVKTM